MSASKIPGAQPPPIPDDLPAWVRELPDANQIPLVDHRRQWIWLGILGVGATIVTGSVLWAWPSGAKMPAAATVTARPQPTPDMTVEFERARALALEHFRAGRNAQAAEAYERAAKLNPGHTGVLAGLGAARARAGDLAGAQQAYQAAVRAAPRHSGFHAALGRVYRDRGQREAAAREYRLALKLDAKNRAARTALAELSRRKHASR